MLASYEISYYNYLKYCGIKHTKIIKLRNLNGKSCAIVEIIASCVRLYPGHFIPVYCNKARVGEGRGLYRVLCGNLRERDHWGDPVIDRRIILRWIIKKWDVVVRTGLSWLRIETGGRPL
jgi:hypothetical protein